MNCIQFKDVIFEYIDGSLETSTMSQANLHMQACPKCSELHRQELNLGDEPLTKLIDDIHELELNEDTITEITTGFVEISKGKKRAHQSG